MVESGLTKNITFYLSFFWKIKISCPPQFAVFLKRYFFFGQSTIVKLKMDAAPAILNHLIILEIFRSIDSSSSWDEPKMGFGIWSTYVFPLAIFWKCKQIHLFTSILSDQISTCFSSIHFCESSIWANSTKANPRDAPTCVTDQHKGVLIPTFLAAAYVYGTPRGCPGVLRHPRGIPEGVSRELIVGQEQGPLQFAIVRMRS